VLRHSTPGIGAVSQVRTDERDMMEVEAIGAFDVKLAPIGSGESPIG
jgi:hypothetical protein